MAKRVLVAKTSDIPLQEARAFPVGDRMIAIFHQEGKFLAMDDFCPHMGASLAGGWVDETTVSCPWHAWRFSLKDGCWLDNPKIKVDMFQVIVEGDSIWVELPDE
jgi:nitrite reductase (NADH) small subunit